MSNPVSLGLRRQEHDDALQNKHRVALQVGTQTPGYQGRTQADTSRNGIMSRALHCVAAQSQLWHLMPVVSWAPEFSAEKRSTLHHSRGAVPLNLTSSHKYLLQLALNWRAGVIKLS